MGDRHLSNTFKTKELERNSVVGFFAATEQIQGYDPNSDANSGDTIRNQEISIGSPNFASHPWIFPSLLHPFLLGGEGFPAREPFGWPFRIV